MIVNRGNRAVPSRIEFRRLIVLCHGPTAATRSDAFPDDEALDTAALPATAALRSSLPRRASIVASPARAARDTVSALGFPDAPTAAALAPRNHGRWRGRTLAAVMNDEPEAARAWLADPASAPGGGEALPSLIARVGHWLDGLGGAPTTIAVADGAIARAAMLHVLGAPAAGFSRLDIGPGDAIELRSAAGRWNWRADGFRP